MPVVPSELTRDSLIGSRPPMRLAMLGGVLLLHLGLASANQLLALPPSLEQFSAFFVKHQAAARIADGQVLYRDHVAYAGTVYHYPPVFLYVLGAAYQFAGTKFLVGRALLTLSTGLCAVVLWLIVRTGRDPETAWLATVAFLANPVLLAGAYVGYFDSFVTLFVLLAVLALLRGYATASGVLLGIGIMSKLFPVLLLPAAALYCHKTETGSLTRVVVGVAVVVVAVSLPFFAVAPEAYLTYAFLFNFDRPTASLSLYYYFLPWLEPTPATVVLPAVIVAAATYAAYRAGLSAVTILDGLPAVLFLGFMLCNRIHYPHYLIYAIPFLSIIFADTVRTGRTMRDIALWRWLGAGFGVLLIGALIWAYPWVQAIPELEGAYYDFTASPYYWLGSAVYFAAGFLLVGLSWRAISASETAS